MNHFKLRNDKIVAIRYNQDGPAPDGWVRANEARSRRFRLREAESLAQGRDGTVLWADGVVELPVDDRWLAVVVITTPDALGVPQVVTQAARGAEVTVTITLPDKGGFNQERVEIFADMYLLLPFVSGVAVVVFTLRKNGLVEFKSNNKFRVENPVEFITYE